MEITNGVHNGFKLGHFVLENSAEDINLNSIIFDFKPRRENS
jgi:hypothetical protein